MAEVSGIIGLDKFVRKMLFKMKRPNDDYMRFLLIAQDGLRYLFMHRLGYITNIKLTVDADTNTIAFPDDYVGYVSLSIPDKGRMWTLTRDDGLIPTTSTDDDGEYLDSDYGEGADISSEYVPVGLGARGGWNDTYYTVDHKQKRFIISGITPSHVILRYVSSGINTSAETYIPLYAEDTLEKFCRWQLSEYDEERRDIVSEKKRAYESALRNMRKFLAPTFDEVRDALYATMNQSIRR